MAKELVLNGYDLSRAWFDFCFENPEKIKPNHTALYFFSIEHCNRLGWKKKFGLPTSMAMEAIGIKSYNTYIETLKDLVEWGFIVMVEKSKNQYSSNIVALSNFNKALDKALDKALIKHGTKQGESTSESIDSINKPLTIEQENKEQRTIIPGSKEPAEIESLFSSIKKSFLAHYQKRFENEYYFRSVDGKKIKSLIGKIKFKIKEKNSGKKESEEITDRQILLAFEYYQSKAFDVGDNWVNSNYSLSTLDSKFNELYTQIKNGKTNNTTSNKREASRSELEALTNRSREFLQSVTA